MKNFKRILALVLAVMMIAACMVTVNAADADKVTFNDEAVNRLASLSIMKGDGAGNLLTGDNITREQMAIFVARAITGEVDSKYFASIDNTTPFKDIDNRPAEAIGAISFAYTNGYIKGRDDTTFDPKGNITYREALTLIVRALGFQDLTYPKGFIAKAEALGLTAMVGGVEYTDVANRGVVATAMYNALVAENSAFAKNFGLEKGTYMLAAVPAQKISDTKTIAAAAFGGFNVAVASERVVVFAKVGADARPVVNDYKTVNFENPALKSALGTDIFVERLGYGYDIMFKEDGNIAWIDAIDPTVIANNGTKVAITTAVKDKAVVGLKLDGVAYDLVANKAADATAPSLVLYTDMGKDVVVKHNEYTSGEYTDWYFNADGNIVNGEGKLAVVLLNGKYFRINYNAQGVDTGKRTPLSQTAYENIVNSIGTPATSKETTFTAAYGIVTETTEFAGSTYLGTTTKNAMEAIAANKFCEIKAFDFDGDGEYDSAIYTPAYFGMAAPKTDTFTLEGVPTADGAKALLSGVKTADYTINGGKLAEWTAYLYTYNRLTKTITLLDKTTTLQNGGQVTAATQGKLTDGVYVGSTVTIGTKKYEVPAFNYENMLGLKTIATFDSSYINAVNAKEKLEGGTLYGVQNPVDYTQNYYNGWNDVLYVGMTARYNNFKGLAIGGYLIHGAPWAKTDSATTPTEKNGFAAINLVQSTYAFDNDKLVVKAVTDKSGAYKEIKVDSIGNTTFTDIDFTLFCAYLGKMNKGNDAAAMMSFFQEDKKNAIINTDWATGKADEGKAYKAFVKAYIEDVLVDGTYDNKAPADLKAVGTLVYAITAENKDGSVKLEAGKALTEFKLKVNVGEVTFSNNIASKGLTLNDKNEVQARITFTENTVWVVVAKEGVFTFNGVPAKNSTLNLTSTAKLLAADAKNVFVLDQTKSLVDILKGDSNGEIVIDKDNKLTFAKTWDVNEFTESTSPVDPTGEFVAEQVYMVTENTVSGGSSVKDGVLVTTFTNLYDFKAGKLVASVELVGENAPVVMATAKAGDFVTLTTVNKTVKVEVFTVAAIKASTNNFFNVDGTSLKKGVYTSQVKDSDGKLAFVNIVGENAELYVRTLDLVVVYTDKDTKKVTIGDESKVAKDATIFYTYDAKTATLTGYAFN